MVPCSWNMSPWRYVCIITIIKWCVRLNDSCIYKFRHSHSAYLRSNLILSFHQCLVLPSSLFSFTFSPLPWQHQLNAVWCSDLLLLRVACWHGEDCPYLVKRHVWLTATWCLWSNFCRRLHSARTGIENFRRPLVIANGTVTFVAFANEPMRRKARKYNDFRLH
jgi:hypothetical protein